jgi:hypothetical protein
MHSICLFNYFANDPTSGSLMIRGKLLQDAFSLKKKNKIKSIAVSY